jgi:hypothetical protein
VNRYCSKGQELLGIVAVSILEARSKEKDSLIALVATEALSQFNDHVLWNPESYLFDYVAATWQVGTHLCHPKQNAKGRLLAAFDSL